MSGEAGRASTLPGHLEGEGEVLPSEVDRGDELEDSILDQIARPTSIVETLRAQREELRGDHTVDMPIPGYQGLLIARYGVVTMKRAQEMGKIIQKVDKDDRSMVGAVDTLIEACRGIYVKVTGEDGKEVVQPIDPAWSQPTLFDQHLADLLAFSAENARECVAQVFPTEQAILKHSILLSRWMQDVTIDLSEELLGE
jgi:hypothetical protein